jgi:hypothetical protein
MKPALESKHQHMRTSSYKAQCILKTIRFGVQILQLCTLIRIVESCSQPVVGCDRNLARYEFDVDFYCPSSSTLHAHTCHTSSAVVHLRGGALSREGRPEFSHASTVSFAPCARLSGRCAPKRPDAALSPPLHQSMPDLGLRQYHEGCAAGHRQHHRPPKLSRSFEAND